MPRCDEILFRKNNHHNWAVFKKSPLVLEKFLYPPKKVFFKTRNSERNIHRQSNLQVTHEVQYRQQTIYDGLRNIVAVNRGVLILCN